MKAELEWKGWALSAAIAARWAPAARWAYSRISAALRQTVNVETRRGRRPKPVAASRPGASSASASAAAAARRKGASRHGLVRPMVSTTTGSSSSTGRWASSRPGTSGQAPETRSGSSRTCQPPARRCASGPAAKRSQAASSSQAAISPTLPTFGSGSGLGPIGAVNTVSAWRRPGTRSGRGGRASTPSPSRLPSSAICTETIIWPSRLPAWLT